MNIPTHVTAKIRELCSIDLRSLALYRMGIALIILWDIFVRFEDVTAHYTDLGLLPRDVLIANFLDTWHLSLYLINGSAPFSMALLAIAAIAAAALLVGYRTRAAAILSWVLLISLHTRNPLILQGGDMMLRLMLFWGMFLPLGAWWSVDEKLAKRAERRETSYCSAASICLLLQICFVYWFTALLKSDSSWTTDGTAVWYALSAEQFTSAFGLSLLNYPTVLKALTFATLYLEAFGPLLAFSPVFTGPLRFAAAATFMLFHLIGLNLAMDIGHFIYVCGVAWIVFLPGWFWNRIVGLADIPATSWSSTKIVNSLAAGCLVYIFLWNVRTLGVAVPALSAPPLSIAGPLLRLDQYWNMFSPTPLRDSGWYVIPGQLRDGSEVDLLKGGAPLSWEKPALISSSFKNDRWKSYMMTLYLSEKNEAMLESFARYLCLDWNESHAHDKQLMTFQIVTMTKVNIAGEAPHPPEKVVLWTHYCFEMPTEGS